MFTGIVDHIATIKAISPIEDGLRFSISSNFNDLQLGESIAVDGACLTVTEINKGEFACDLSPETLRLTTAEQYQVGQAVNLERAMLATDRFGGHIVQGHVDQVAVLLEKKQHHDFCEMIFGVLNATDELRFVKKGSITLNGVSLTVNNCSETYVGVTLIPHTLERTNLSHLETGDKVNVEFDYVTHIVSENVKHMMSQLEAVHAS